MSDHANVKIPSEAKQASLLEAIRDDEDFKFPTIKVNRDKPRFEIPAPTNDDPENFVTAPSFKAVVLGFRKFVPRLTEEEIEDGKKAQEKRFVVVLREGRITPEAVYINPTSIEPWAVGLKAIKNADLPVPIGAALEFSLERVKSKSTGFSWNKFKFALAEPVSEDGLTYLEALSGAVNERLARFDRSSDALDFEAELLGEKPKKPEDSESRTKKAMRSLEEDEEPTETKKAAGKKKPAAPAVEEEDGDDISDLTETKPAAEKPAKKAAPVIEEEEEE